MNGTQSPDAQKASNANTNGSNSNNSSLAAKKRKKDLKPIITMEGTNQPAGPWAFTNLGSLDRSLGPLYLILVCPEGGAVSHLPVAPLIVPEASVG
ncbi:unnamed protein product [Fusarium fujikuroi]|uniref:Uncharacterized protein n=1 Tax=Fusarium fujikuroi TaxID=5127 RepID=A0A9Q9RZN5_FUSFU|nr:uncharacterized protein FFM5_15213 [Fusarium fujikuroi]SCO53059.1 uncharacterized protein FFNC_14590 [Fusarium fujikuroi]VTT74527.1 unnamed protein product [Fusarium fujikuroi]VTT83342.1 unnamed protein product [Fusarium fujikuroi]VZH92266.1 unnamed protein product [Fusarium fujikuroi]